MFSKKINGFIVKVSTRKNKKYDVFDEEDNYILSFGSLPMQHYKDRIGYYKDLDHNDVNRLERFNNRFRRLINKNKNNPFSAMYWSSKYLW